MHMRLQDPSSVLKGRIGVHLLREWHDDACQIIHPPSDTVGCVLFQNFRDIGHMFGTQPYM